jgi:short-subunit dehydrogenase
VKIDREKMLAAAPSLLPPEQCARVILRGVERNKAFIVVTPLAKFMWLFHRLKPELVLWLWQRQMNKFNEIRIPDEIKA